MASLVASVKEQWHGCLRIAVLPESAVLPVGHQPLSQYVSNHICNVGLAWLTGITLQRPAAAVKNLPTRAATTGPALSRLPTPAAVAAASATTGRNAVRTGALPGEPPAAEATTTAMQDTCAAPIRVGAHPRGHSAATTAGTARGDNTASSSGAARAVVTVRTVAAHPTLLLLLLGLLHSRRLPLLLHRGPPPHLPLSTKVLTIPKSHIRTSCTGTSSCTSPSTPHRPARRYR